MKTVFCSTLTTDLREDYLNLIQMEWNNNNRCWRKLWLKNIPEGYLVWRVYIVLWVKEILHHFALKRSSWWYYKLMLSFFWIKPCPKKVMVAPLVLKLTRFHTIAFGHQSIGYIKDAIMNIKNCYHVIPFMSKQPAT